MERRLKETSGTAIRALEPNTPWANRAELYIQIFKDVIRNELRRSDCPLVLWDYCAEHKALTNNVTVSNLPQAQGQTPYQTVYNEEADISNVCQFAFYDWGKRTLSTPTTPRLNFLSKTGCCAVSWALLKM